MSHILDYHIDLLAVTESWLSPDSGVVIKSVCPDGYAAVHLPRPNRRGGGLALIQVKCLPLTQPTSFELLDLVLLFRSQRIRLLLVYRPPSSSATCFLDEFSAILETVSVTRDRLVILGDFNFHIESKSDRAALAFIGLMDSFGFNQNVNASTHIKGHTLDLILSRDADNLVSGAMVSSLISDHHPSTVFLMCEPHCGQYAGNPIVPTSRLMTSYLHLTFSSLTFFPTLREVNDLVTQYNEGLSSVVDKHAPLRERVAVARPSVPWLTDDVRQMKRQLRKAERLWRIRRLHVDYDIYVHLLKDFSAFIKKTKRVYFSNKVLECGRDTKALHRLVDNCWK